MSVNISFVEIDKFLLDKKSKILHQVWFGTIPNKKSAKKSYQKMALYRDSWIEKNSDWFRFEWDREKSIILIKMFYPEHLEMFQKYKYEIQRCDIIRYLILHRYGGWYVDMDYYCNRPLNEAMKIYKNDIYFVQTPNKVIVQDDDHISNSLMYSVAGHPFWRQIMIELEKIRDYPYYYGKHISVMFTTGPGILNRIYSRYKYKYKVKSLPWKLFHPFGIGDEKLKLRAHKNVFAIHIGKGSWENKDSMFFLFWLREWKIMLFIILFFISNLFIYFKK